MNRTAAGAAAAAALFLAACSTPTSTGSTGASGGTPAKTESTASGSICPQARLAWHDANSLKVSVAVTKADEQKLVDMAGGAERTLNEKYAAVSDAMAAVYRDGTNGSAAFVNQDLPALVKGCKGAGE